MKKRPLLRLPAVVLLLCAGFVWWIVSRPDHVYVFVDSGLSQEEILEEMPSVEIAENDYALAAALSVLPEVREAAERQKDGVEFQIEDFRDLFSAYLPEALDSDDSWLEIWERGVNVSYTTPTGEEDRIQRTFLHWGLDTPESIHKTIGVYEENEYGFIPACRATYDNENNETYIKEVEKRDWLYPLKEKLSAE